MLLTVLILQQHSSCQETTCSGVIINQNLDGNSVPVMTSTATDVGPQGHPGKRGPQGVAGVKGEKGEQGATGATGATGQGFDLAELQEMKEKLEQMQTSLEQCNERTSVLEEKIKFVDNPRTCGEIASDLGSGFYTIQPNYNVGPFKVYSNFATTPASTEISHDSEAEISADGYDADLSYTRNITYNATMPQIIALINQATTCKQHINYKCYNSALHWSSGTIVAAWYSRNREQMSSWGNTATPGSCECGDTGTCADSSLKCNCDKNDDVWREDGGFLSDTTKLPVTIMKFGDTGSNEHGKHTLGKLVCI